MLLYFKNFFNFIYFDFTISFRLKSRSHWIYHKTKLHFEPSHRSQCSKIRQNSGKNSWNHSVEEKFDLEKEINHVNKYVNKQYTCHKCKQIFTSQDFFKLRWTWTWTYFNPQRCTWTSTHFNPKQGQRIFWFKILKDIWYFVVLIFRLFASICWNFMLTEEKKHRLSLIHIWRCRRYSLCRSRWSPYH